MEPLQIVRITKPKTLEEKRTKTVVDTVLITKESVRKWASPPFQRPLKENAKVQALALELRTDSGVLPGVLTLGVLDGVTYLIDGQHRVAAFVMSDLAEGYTDIRVHHFKSLADMGDEFVKLNSSLVKLRPDDILRGLESSVSSLQLIREKCPFVGYDSIRRGPSSPLLSMSTSLRSWKASAPDIPSRSSSDTAIVIARGMDDVEVENFCSFLNLALKGFGRDQEYARLWGGLNLCLSMWLYRRIVLTQYSARTARIGNDLFSKCLMSLSANHAYLDWLLGRQMGERDRSPAYARIKSIFANRISNELGTKTILPSPSWSVTH